MKLDENRIEGDRTSPSSRLVSLDVLRGLAIVILLLAGNPFMREHLPSQLKHPEWHGLRFADLFFPVFLFVVGIAMTLSRRAGSFPRILKRVGLLALIGIILTSLKHGRVVVPGVLQHIAVSYLLAWMILRAPRKAQALIAAGILAGMWLGFVLWADPGADPWSMEEGFAHAMNRLFFGGFATEGVPQAITSSVTVLGGAFIGRGIRERKDPPRSGDPLGAPRALLRWVSLSALWLIAAGLLMSLEVPINKRIWSPSYTLLTLGIACALFAIFIWFIDVRGHRRWVAPMQVLGMNPIAIYVVYITVRALLANVAASAPSVAPFGSETAGALTYSLGWLLVGWAFAQFLYRRKIFIKI